MKTKLLRGVAISHGYGFGKAVLIEFKPPNVKRVKIPAEKKNEEKERFLQILDKSLAELKNVKKFVESSMLEEYKDFFDVQMSILSDVLLKELTTKRIDEGFSAEYSFSKALETLTNSIKVSGDFFAERLLDINDAQNRVLRHLLGSKSKSSIVEIREPSVLVSDNIPPSEAIFLDKRYVKGIVTVSGGKTSHISIVARGLDIPAVSNIDISKISSEDLCIVDGLKGYVWLNPNKRRLNYYKKKIDEREKVNVVLKETKTTDGKKIDISANVEFIEEVDVAKKLGAEGIGLYRTEFIFLIRRRIPSVNEQFKIYKKIAERMSPNPVIIRTVDIGGDKILHEYIEENPFLGWRAIRLFKRHEEILRNQIRAILMSSHYGHVKIMFPMVASYDEIIWLKELVQSEKEQLKANSIPFDNSMEVGIMIEIPSAAILSDKFAEIVDFFSIGTNDLTQYTLAVDRGNEKVSDMFDHLHPAVLRLIKMTVGNAHRFGKWVGVCGEMAADPLAIPVLIGLGVDELSMSPGAIRKAAGIVRVLKFEKLNPIIKRTFQKETAEAVRRFLRRSLVRIFPDIRKFLIDL